MCHTTIAWNPIKVVDICFFFLLSRSAPRRSAAAGSWHSGEGSDSVFAAFMEQLATAALQPNDFAPQKKEGSDVILLGLRCVTQPNRLHFFIVYLCDCALCEVNIPHPRLQPRPGRRGADRQEVQDVKRGRKFKSNLDIDQQPFAPPGGNQTRKPNTGHHYLTCHTHNKSSQRYTTKRLQVQLRSVSALSYQVVGHIIMENRLALTFSTCDWMKAGENRNVLQMYWRKNRWLYLCDCFNSIARLNSFGSHSSAHKAWNVHLQ